MTLALGDSFGIHYIIPIGEQPKEWPDPYFLDGIGPLGGILYGPTRFFQEPIKLPGFKFVEMPVPGICLASVRWREPQSQGDTGH